MQNIYIKIIMWKKYVKIYEIVTKSDYPFGIIKLFLYHNVKHTLDILSSVLDIVSWMYFICSGVDGLLSILVIQISHLQIIVFVVKHFFFKVCFLLLQNETKNILLFVSVQ